MTANELLDLVEDLEAAGFDITHADMRRLATYDDPETARWDWMSDHADGRDEALTVAQRNI